MRKLWILLFCLLITLPAMAEEELSMTDVLSGVDEQVISGISTGFTEDDVVELTDDEEEARFEKDGSILLTISATGDFTIGGDSRKKKNIFEAELKKNDHDINYIMRNVRDLLLGDDMTLVNFEGTLTDSTYVPSSKSGNEFLFNAPPAYVSVLGDNGVEAVSLENNHIMDHGQEVYEETQTHLEEAGIVWSNSTHVGVYEVKGIQIAMLSYLCIDRYDSLWSKVPADIAAAKAQYPLVIVSFHWGNEKDYTPTNNQVKMGRLAVDSGADLVIGHHSHRIQPIEQYNGVYICYSLGNFCFAGNSKPSDMSSMIFQTRFRIHLSEDGLSIDRIVNEGFRIVPIRISSTSSYNDFQPTPLTADTAIDSVLTTLKSNGKKLDYVVENYPLTW